MSAFNEAVERNLKGLEHVSVGGCRGCDECGVGEFEDPAGAEEGHFSKQPCDCCGAVWFGSRYPAHGRLTPEPDGKIVHLDVCVDCLAFIANGEEPEEWQP